MPLALLSLPPPPLVLSLPPRPALLTLPAGTLDHSTPLDLSELVPSLMLLGLVSSAILLLVRFVWQTRASVFASSVTAHCDYDAHGDETIIDLSCNAYDGKMVVAGDELIGVMDAANAVLISESTTPPAPSGQGSTPFPPATATKARKSRARGKAKRAQTTPNIIPPLLALESIAADEHENGEWKTWTNRRRRRPPRPPSTEDSAPLALSRSSSVFSSSCSSDTTLFSSMSSASTAPTSVASSRRSSIAAFSPVKRCIVPSSSTSTSYPSPSRMIIHSRIRTPGSIASYNKYSILELHEGEG
ncbi:hypothetical protein C8Q77DRAFT_1098354 [Trametes polyzona]|nr:hypothetical protein C8Q77DRAFT_1098354 [Trametes polyzona]